MVEWQRVRFAVFAATLLCARTSAAQRHGGGGRGGAAGQTGAGDVAGIKSAPVAGEASEVAEDRMRAGDCAGALDAFDQALRKNISPELRRDRGTCHEKLGHPFPAMDDYRAYLEARPNAPDADAIRARLVALEAQTGKVKKGDEKAAGGGVMMSIGGDTGTGGSIDAQERGELLDTQADTSALRRGKGLELGVAFEAKHFGSSGFGWAEGGGLDLRYSFSRVSTIVAEVTVSHVNGASSSATLSGPGVLGGYEARIPLNARLDDAILLGATFGYEHLSLSSVGYVFSVLEPRGHVGYRHVFGPALGVELTLDAGEAFVHLTSAPAGADANTSTSLIGGHLAVVMGF
jgi:hypothetical protein